MATPDAFSANMIEDIAKAMENYQPRQSLLMSAGFRREAMARIPAATSADQSNPLLAGYAITQSFMGVPVERFDIPPEEVIDWSGCRSPSRAKRRHARGIPQRIKIELRERAYLINRDALALA